MPCATDPSVPDEHGRTAIPRVTNEPDEIGASMAPSPWRTTFARVRFGRPPRRRNRVGADSAPTSSRATISARGVTTT